MGFYVQCPKKKIQILENKFDEDLTKNFIRTNSTLTTSPTLFAHKPGENSRFSVNYKTFHAITIVTVRTQFS